MSKGLVATAAVQITAPIDKVWNALTDPELIKQYMFGTEVVSEFKEGSPIIWRGVWEGKPYEDKGVIMKKEVMKTLQFTHFSPLTGIPDVKENYHTVTYKLAYEGDRTLVTLSQDNNPDEKSMKHSAQNWDRMLKDLKKVMEGQRPS